MSELNNNENRLAELKKLGELRAAGVLSDEEFEVEKNRILSATMQPIESDLYKAGSFATRPIESTRRPVDITFKMLLNNYNPKSAKGVVNLISLLFVVCIALLCVWLFF